MNRNFRELLEKLWDQKKFLCIGLDSDVEKIPEAIQQDSTSRTIVAFNRAIIDTTKDIVCAYKFNSAFYEAHGDEGWNALRESITYIQEHTRIPVILDAKRGDIGNTNKGYVDAAFEHLRADAITVNPYPGAEALAPFLERAEKGIIVWCRTSNPGAGEFQDLLIDGEAFYRVVARHVATTWNKNGNCAIVVGATYPKELGEIREIVGDMPILIPGIGAQGGELEKTIEAGKDTRGRGMIITISRSVIFASSGKDFAEVAGNEARRLDGKIRAVVQ